MSAYLVAFITALLGWWLSTGVILYLNLLPRDSHRWSVLAFSTLGLFSLTLLPHVAGDPTPLGAAAGFAIALAVWGWLEISYLMDFITGTHNRPCPPEARGWRRFRLALGTSIHHELAVAGAGIAIIALSWGGDNQVATGTYLVLWIMRWSAKLNLYLGVSNFNEHWLPERSRYLVTYMRKRRMNYLFPVSITLGTAGTVLLLRAAIGAGDDFGRLGNTLVCSLLALAVLEHWFLVLPLRDSALWQWAISAADRARGRPRPEPRAERPVTAPAATREARGMGTG
ncbi:putative photosynthetic complex assembly protein PuhE [Pseudohaliea sp.]|uniref:putative photosynthetic complex assembly protein PuhE n=1 Tax=Pseudohaliea sp. TaxID=2740289 RepID=UPI0032ED0E76